MSLRRGVAVALVLGAVVVTVVLLRSGGQGNPTVARVAGQPITREQLDAVVEHFRLEAKGEGKPVATRLATRRNVRGTLPRNGGKETRVFRLAYGLVNRLAEMN